MSLRHCPPRQNSGSKRLPSAVALPLAATTAPATCPAGVALTLPLLWLVTATSHPARKNSSPCLPRGGSNGRHQRPPAASTSRQDDWRIGTRLLRSRARSAPPPLRSSATSAYVSCSSELLSVAAARAIATSLFSLLLGNAADVDGTVPDLSDVFAEDVPAPSLASRLPLRASQ